MQLEILNFVIFVEERFLMLVIHGNFCSVWQILYFRLARLYMFRAGSAIEFFCHLACLRLYLLRNDITQPIDRDGFLSLS